ncbi:hypothetical protein CSUI_006687 [Cystoisospora suis]|uniref:Uncharacterized protein n=1 Tax=Cystoisospora suis TaxID=483139 RepID=A0A2C6KTI7_9APIC|nr:hypothetical protein CSUI_006687 [Cystoisospora suis]
MLFCMYRRESFPLLFFSLLCEWRRRSRHRSTADANKRRKGRRRRGRRGRRRRNGFRWRRGESLFTSRRRLRESMLKRKRKKKKKKRHIVRIATSLGRVYMSLLLV